MSVKLEARQTDGASVTATLDQGWQLSIPAGPRGAYRWAQLDDYLHQSRSRFAWTPPITLSLNARVSANDIPGTWGFGTWNDPFSASLGLGGMARRLPALPNAAWFFYASAPNYLSLENQLPAQGFLAATFQSPLIPSILLAPALAALPFMLWPPAARLARRFASRIIRQSSARVNIDPTAWRHYQMTWSADQVIFTVHDVPTQELLFSYQTPLSPRGRCGLVLWIDNQYAAFNPDGRLAYGTLAHAQPAWLELKDIKVETTQAYGRHPTIK